MRYEPLLCFDCRPHIGVEGVLGNVAVYLHLGVFVALPDNASFALLYVGRPPRAIEVMFADEQFLYVGARAHLCGGAKQHTHLTCAHL